MNRYTSPPPPATTPAYTAVTTPSPPLSPPQKPLECLQHDVSPSKLQREIARKYTLISLVSGDFLWFVCVALTMSYQNSRAFGSIWFIVEFRSLSQEFLPRIVWNSRGLIQLFPHRIVLHYWIFPIWQWPMRIWPVFFENRSYSTSEFLSTGLDYHFSKTDNLDQF